MISSLLQKKKEPKKPKIYWVSTRYQWKHRKLMTSNNPSGTSARLPPHSMDPIWPTCNPPAGSSADEVAMSNQRVFYRCVTVLGKMEDKTIACKKQSWKKDGKTRKLYENQRSSKDLFVLKCKRWSMMLDFLGLAQWPKGTVLATFMRVAWAYLGWTVLGGLWGFRSFSALDVGGVFHLDFPMKDKVNRPTHEDHPKLKAPSPLAELPRPKGLYSHRHGNWARPEWPWRILRKKTGLVGENVDVHVCSVV